MSKAVGGASAALALAIALTGPAAVASGQASVVAPLAASSLLLDLTRAGARLIAVGQRGHVLLSDDSATSWRQVSTPTRETLTAVYFIDDSNGFALGHDAVILRTSDAGENWQLVYSAPEEEAPLLAMHFTDAEKGMAVGAYAYVVTTDDGGETWQAGLLNDEDDFHLNSLQPNDDGELLIAAEAGLIYLSTDQGGSWDYLESPYEGSFFGAWHGTREMLVFGLRGHLFRSTDGGEQWQQIEVGTDAMLTDAASLPDGRKVVVGLQGIVLTGRDEDYAVYQLPSREGLAGVLALDDDVIVVAGEAGVKRLRLDSLQLLPESE